MNVSPDPRLVRLRVELYTALQMLKGKDLVEFEQLITEVYLSLPRLDLPPEG